MYADSISVRDIYEAGQAAINYAKGLTKEEILADQMRLQAIKYQLIVIGEAAVRLSDSFRNNHPKITWREMIGMRNILVPQYHRVELDIIWGVVQNSVPCPHQQDRATNISRLERTFLCFVLNRLLK